MRYSDVDHPLSTNQILQYFDSMYGLVSFIIFSKI